MKRARTPKAIPSARPILTYSPGAMEFPDGAVAVCLDSRVIVLVAVGGAVVVPEARETSTFVRL